MGKREGANSRQDRSFGARRQPPEVCSGVTSKRGTSNTLAPEGLTSTDNPEKFYLILTRARVRRILGACAASFEPYALSPSCAVTIGLEKDGTLHFRFGLSFPLSKLSRFSSLLEAIDGAKLLALCEYALSTNTPRVSGDIVGTSSLRKNCREH